MKKMKALSHTAVVKNRVSSLWTRGSEPLCWAGIRQRAHKGSLCSAVFEVLYRNTKADRGSVCAEELMKLPTLAACRDAYFIQVENKISVFHSTQVDSQSHLVPFKSHINNLWTISSSLLLLLASWILEGSLQEHEAANSNSKISNIRGSNILLEHWVISLIIITNLSSKIEYFNYNVLIKLIFFLFLDLVNNKHLYCLSFTI